jgi:hypothetical protein
MTKITYQPCVVVVHGPMYHGKSTVAGELAYQSKNLLHFDLDDIKTHMFRNSPEPSPRFISEENTRRTNAAYEEAASRAMILLEQGIPSIFSGTFSWESFKTPFIMLVLKGKIPRDKLKIFDLKVDSHVEIKRRIRLRENPNVDVEEKYRKYLWSKEQQSTAPWPTGLNPKSVNGFHSLDTVAAAIASDLIPFKQAA